MFGCNDGSGTIDPESMNATDAFIDHQPAEPADAGDTPAITDRAAPADPKTKPKRQQAKSAKKPSEVVVPKPKAEGSPSIKPKSGKKPKGS